jgi:hypothetical protein
VSNILVQCGVCLGAATASVVLSTSLLAEASDAPDEWLIEDRAGVLQLRLAHAERRRPDGGILSVDPNRRVVTWQGIPGELGCRQKLEAGFSRIRAVRDESAGFLRLELKGEPRDRWLFIPLPHAAWLAQASSSIVSGFAPDVRDSLIGPDGFSLPVGGSAALAGPQSRADIVPREVTFDVRRAAERIRRWLGRTALPTVQAYEALHGRPVEVGVAELLDDPGRFEGRAVRVRGVARTAHGRGIELADGDSSLPIVPQPEIAAVVDAAAGSWRGLELEVSGVVRRMPGSGEGPSHEIAFWEYTAPDQVAAPASELPTVEIRDLLERPAQFAGATVRVVGRFRGRNLSHDLPEPGPRGAWVIKSGRHALWVVGHGPSGRGFSLHPHLAADTARWLEVAGRVEQKDGFTVLRAAAVALSAPAASVWSGPRLHSAPPDVVFTLPVGDDEVPAADARLLVQFSTYMDEESFEDRVRLRYVGVGGAGEELRRERWSYDDVRRVLIVDPGEPLRAGAVLELLLLRGITDIYAAPLKVAPGAAPDDTAQALRWRVSGDPTPAAGLPGETAPDPL